MPRIRPYYLVFLLLASTVAVLPPQGYANAEIAAASAPQVQQRMQKHLRAYEAIASHGGWPAFRVGSTLQPGDNDERIATLRAILLATGDDSGTTDTPDLTHYDAMLKTAVIAFQRRHALDADGVLGAKTQAALAVPVEERIAQLQASLENMQAVALPESGRYIVVNIPGYTLQAMENERIALTSRVIVGRPDRATPEFERNITHVNFNPAWNVPHKIASRDILKKLRKDPAFLQKSGFTVRVHGEETSPDDIDWSQVSSNNFPYELRQRAGDSNALGKVKFTLPDTDSIYLHSTSHPELFAKAERDLSSGCVRVEEAEKLTAFVLEGAEGWDSERIERTYQSSKTATVKVPPLPVYIVYWPAWVDTQSGELHFHPDIYGRNAQRVAELLDGAQKQRVMTLASK